MALNNKHFEEFSEAAQVKCLTKDKIKCLYAIFNLKYLNLKKNKILTAIFKFCIYILNESIITCHFKLKIFEMKIL